MLTTPITNTHFHSRVLTLLNAYNQAVAEDSGSSAQPLPLLSSLEDVDTPLTPHETITQLLIYTSSWIDLGSPDPVIAYLSRQVFSLEIKYAAFCGATTIVVPGPRLSNGTSGISQYARALKEAFPTAGYVQFHILMPMDGTKSAEDQEDLGHLARFARPEYVQQASSPSKSSGAFSAWDAWNTVRSICKYHIRLSVGKNRIHVSLQHEPNLYYKGLLWTMSNSSSSPSSAQTSIFRPSVAVVF
jgi:protein arginine N-methyltransferase 5